MIKFKRNCLQHAVEQFFLRSLNF